MERKKERETGRREKRWSERKLKRATRPQDKEREKARERKEPPPARPSSAHKKKLAIEAAEAAHKGKAWSSFSAPREPYSLFLNLSSPIPHQYTHAPHPVLLLRREERELIPSGDLSRERRRGGAWERENR